MKRCGKRVSKNGNIYTENRKGKCKPNPKRRLKNGGVLNKKVSLKELFTK